MIFQLKDAFLTDRTLLTAMKNKVISLMSGLAMVAGLAVGPAVLASNSADVTKALAGSTALELPAKAANLVAKASTADKKNVAVAAVKAAVALDPSAVTTILSAVARENPAMAPVAAVTAGAARALAPSAVTTMVSAVARENPPMAPVPPATAATLQHKQIGLIT